MSKKSDIGFFDFAKIVFEVLTDSSPSKSRQSNHNDGYERCSDCGGTGRSDQCDDDGSHACLYCGGKGKWEKSA